VGMGGGCINGNLSVTFTKAHRYIQAKEKGGENGKLGIKRSATHFQGKRKGPGHQSEASA
jgi:hypothetical protein